MQQNLPVPPPPFPTSRLEVRPLGPHDAPERLQEVFAAAGDYFLSVTGRPEPDPDAAARELAATATAGRNVALLTLRETEEPVGAVGWWEGHPEPDLALLGMLVVVRARRGAGLAREALRGLETELAARGIRRLRTGVGAGDERAHALLRALGFEPLDQRRHVSLDRGRMMIALFEKATAPAPDHGDQAAPAEGGA